MSPDVANWVARTMEEIAAARPADVQRGRDALAAMPVEPVEEPEIPNVIANLGMTRAWLAETTPAEWAAAADHLLAVLRREPVKSSGAYGSVRVLLGVFANDLDSYARCAGEPSRQERSVSEEGVRP